MACCEVWVCDTFTVLFDNSNIAYSSYSFQDGACLVEATPHDISSYFSRSLFVDFQIAGWSNIVKRV